MTMIMQNQNEGTSGSISAQVAAFGAKRQYNAAFDVINENSLRKLFVKDINIKQMTGKLSL